MTCGHSPYVFRRPEVQEESTLNGTPEESFSLHGSSKEHLDPLHTPGPTLPLTHLRNGQTEHFGAQEYSQTLAESWSKHKKSD